VMASLRPGDTLVVWRLDRLGRSLPRLAGTFRALKQRDVGFSRRRRAKGQTP